MNQNEILLSNKFCKLKFVYDAVYSCMLKFVNIYLQSHLTLIE